MRLIININNTIYFNFNRLGTTSSLFNNYNTNIDNANKASSKNLDNIDISLSSLIKSRSQALSKDITTQTQPIIQDLTENKDIVAVPKPDGVDIDDEKWSVLVAIAKEKGITDPQQIANLTLSDIGESKILSGTALQYTKTYAKEKGITDANLSLSDIGASATESASPLQYTKTHSPESMENSGMSIKEIAQGWEMVYHTSDKLKFDGKLADADIESLISIHEGLKNNDRGKLESGINGMIKSGNVSFTRVADGQVYSTAQVGADAVEYYFNKGKNIIGENPGDVDRIHLGLLSELSGILDEDLDGLTLGNLDRYINKFKHSAAVEIDTVLSDKKSYDTKLTDLDRYSLYCIVEGIKQNNGSMFNEGFISRKAM